MWDNEIQFADRYSNAEIKSDIIYKFAFTFTELVISTFDSFAVLHDKTLVTPVTCISNNFWVFRLCGCTNCLKKAMHNDRNMSQYNTDQKKG